MSRNEARHLINTEARLHTVVVYFTKRDGTQRRMVCRYFGASSRKPHLMVVWDLEKGAIRSVNLDTVSRITVARPRKDREPVEPKRTERTFAEVQAEIDELF